MNSIFSFVIVFLSSLTALAQKEDYQWIVGHYENAIIDFNGSYPIPVEIVSDTPVNFFLTHASACDSNGHLIFYTDGRNIYNKNFEIMDNGNNLSPEIDLLDTTWEGRYNICQGAIAVPYPDHKNQFYVFHERLIWFPGHVDFQPFNLYYSIVDINQNDGQGNVIQKNVVLHSDTLVNGKLMACKHANGRDWWLFCHEYKNNTFLRWLITPDGIDGPFQQSIGSEMTKYDAWGQLVFSPDGKKCALFNVTLSMFLDLFEFDRCTGMFTNYSSANIPFLQDSSDLNGGLAFSPNSRFLYATMDRNIYQFDTWASDWQNSRITVGTWDGSNIPLPTYFWLCQLAPDNKIYISTSSGTSVMHVINNPDSLGLKCNFVQHQFLLPVINGVIPNFPHFRMPPYLTYQYQNAPDLTIHSGDTVMIGSPAIDGLVYYWTPAENISDVTVAKPLVYPSQNKTYYLTATDTANAGSCNNIADTVVVTVIEQGDTSVINNCNMAVANLVQVNEMISIMNILPQTTFEVFDLLGRKLYFNTDYHNNWKPEVAGMFLYRVICPDGGTVEGKVVAVR
ncbi:MAG TPA: hypothetical protein PLD84_12215 [Chitinophagales bacterium]|nr:hypothetical protein [Chitinophagales bacterium]